MPSRGRRRPCSAGSRGSGTPHRPRLFAEISPPGRPDGMAVDTEGNVWSAIAGGGHLVCFSPAGTELHREPIPVPTPTSCCFAGPERDRLIVTTSRKRMNATALAAHP
ncbi:SMP-30/gluconolactonase/LRE family protein [Nonomuraea sp. 3N208]|uniref:SMP-30/gluconolactonase/LRE family protein n=1 Tax=Nonomuraea sp. 3N208 TaxID=3457421 RepID=UPI003FCD3CF5